MSLDGETRQRILAMVKYDDAWGRLTDEEREEFTKRGERP